VRDQHDDAHARRALENIPNVGPATAGDLLRLGIREPAQLGDCDPDELYERLCRLDGRRHDPCVRDVFAAAVWHARGGGRRPWWDFSRERKAAGGPRRTR